MQEAGMDGLDHGSRRDATRVAMSGALRTPSRPLKMARLPHRALKKLAADIRTLSAGRPQTPAEDLLRESRDQR